MRHRKAPKRLLQPDSIYQSMLITKLINYVMHDGKKTVAQQQVYAALDALKTKGLDPIETLNKVIDTVGPKVELKARRVGGANYQVPVDVKPERKTTLALRWILEAARSRSNKEYHTFAEKLVAECLDALEEKGAAITKRNNTLRQAEANKAFSHFRW